MTRGVDKHLLKQFTAGSAEAFATLVERKRRIVRRFLVAAAGAPDVDGWEAEVFSRAHTELRKMDADEDDLTIHLLDILRDLTFSRLPEAEYRKTLFSTGRECFSSPPAVPPLPRDALSGESWPDLTPWLAALDDRQQLLLELIFLEAAPLNGIAELINCSETMLSAFLFHLFDSMAELSALPHKDGCPPGLLIGLEIVKSRGHRTKVAKLKEEHGGCAGCNAIIDRCVALAGVWGKEWRPEPLGTEALLTRIAPGAQRTGKMVKSDPEFAPIREMPKPRPSRGKSLVLMGVILVAFVWGSVAFLDRGERPAAQQPDGGQARLRGASERKLPTRVGAMSSASAASEPLFDGSVVATDLRNPASLAYESGVKIELAPGGSGRTSPSGFSLIAGRVKVEVPAGGKSPFTVSSGDLQLTSSGGELSVLRTPGRRTVLAVERGSATVTLPDGRKVALDPGRQASIDLSTGRSTVSDYAPADFSSLAGSDTAGGGSGTGAPTAPPPRPLDSGGDAGGGGNRGTSAGGGVRPGDARGFRDSF